MAGARRRNRGASRGADPLWSKAPLVLLRYPGLFVSIAVGALLLALAASAYPLFISSSASELVTARIHDPSYTRWAVGMMYRNGALPLPGPVRHGDIEPEVDTIFQGLVDASPYLGAPLESALSTATPITVAGEQERRDTRLFTGEQVLDHVDILEGSADDGVLVPDLISDALDITPGDEIVIGSPDTGTVTFPVGGIYRSLYKGGASGYWRPWNDALVLYCADCAPPPQAVIVPKDRFADAARSIGLDHAAFAWQAPVLRDLTLQEAEDAARIASRISDEIDHRSLLDRCYIAFFCSQSNGPVWGSAMDDVVREVHGRLVAIDGPARLLRIAGMLVALVVVAGAGAFVMAARRVESSLLFARGARPRAVGGRSALEAVIPCAVGAGLGLVLAFVLVRWAGPGGALASSASEQAMWAAGAAGVVAVVAIAVVSTVSFLRQSEHHRSRLRVVGAFPWELVLIGLSLVILQRLRTGGAVVVDRSLGTEAPSLLLFAFPIAFLAGFVALVARVVVLVLHWARGRSGGWGTPAYLAVHRLAARSRLTMLLIAAAGLCLGLFVQAQTVARSMQTTVDAKAGVYVGSDVQARIDSVNATPEDFPLPVTRAVRRLEAGELRPGVPFDLLAIDTETFASAAFWDPAFSSEPLETLLDRISAPSGWQAPRPDGLGAERVPGLDHARPNDPADRDRRARRRVPRDDVAPSARRGRRGTPAGGVRRRPEPVDRLERERRALDPRNAAGGAGRAGRPRLHAVAHPYGRRGEGHLVHRGGDRHLPRDERARGPRGPARVRRDADVPADAPTLRDRLVRALVADGDAVLAPPGRDRDRGGRDAPDRVRRGHGAGDRRGPAHGAAP